MKNYFGAAAAVFVILFSAIKYLDHGSSEAIRDAERDTETAILARVAAEEALDSMTMEYERAMDSLSVIQDSISDVIDSAQKDAAEASMDFEEKAKSLQDSLAVLDSGLAEQLGQVVAEHDRVVAAMSAEIKALNEDRKILWQRIEYSDSLLSAQVQLNNVLQMNIMAIENERDAWRTKANPSLPKRLVGHAPAILTGAVLLSVLR